MRQHLALAEVHTHLFDPSTSRRMLDHFSALLGGVVAEPTAAVGTLPLMPTDELHALRSFGRGRSDYPVSPSVAHALAVQLAATPDALVRIPIDPPTIRVRFSPNTSPFAGREGKFVTSRQIGERLRREALGNVSIQIEAGDSAESFEVAGRGELQLAVLIETMRRETLNS